MKSTFSFTLERKKKKKKILQNSSLTNYMYVIKKDEFIDSYFYDIKTSTVYLTFTLGRTKDCSLRTIKEGFLESYVLFE